MRTAPCICPDWRLLSANCVDPVDTSRRPNPARQPAPPRPPTPGSPASTASDAGPNPAGPSSLSELQRAREEVQARRSRGPCGVEHLRLTGELTGLEVRGRANPAHQVLSVGGRSVRLMLQERALWAPFMSLPSLSLPWGAALALPWFAPAPVAHGLGLLHGALGSFILRCTYRPCLSNELQPC